MGRLRRASIGNIFAQAARRQGDKHPESQDRSIEKAKHLFHGFSLHLKDPFLMTCIMFLNNRYEYRPKEVST